MSKQSLDEFSRNKLRSLERRQLRRQQRVTDPAGGMIVERDGRRLISFSSNDYLGLANDPAVVAAAMEATRKYGAGAGASRLITGNHALYTDLEQALADIKNTEDAVVFGSGYLANLGAIPLLAAKPDLILIDELAHSCLLSGARLSEATVLHFAHNDASEAAALLEQQRKDYRYCLILTEGVFSMDGDLAPLPALAELAGKHDAWLLTDDAHGLGVVGGGRGSGFAFDADFEVPLQMGTLSKAVGSYGGYLCASHAVCELLRNRARSYVYSTGLPPGTIAAATTALNIIRDDPQRVARPLALARQFTHAFDRAAAESAVVPWLLGTSENALAAAAALEDQGYLVAPIRPPTVPAGTARLRISFSAAHSDDDVDGLIRALQTDSLQTPGSKN